MKQTETLEERTSTVVVTCEAMVVIPLTTERTGAIAFMMVIQNTNRILLALAFCSRKS